MKTGDAREFQIDDAVYSLKLVELKNALVDEDFATFVIADATRQTLSKNEKIERLISAIEAMDSAVFIRNGSEHAAKDAADHLRQKLNAADAQIDSASEFIDRVASHSSITGEEYKIRLRAYCLW